MPYNADQYTNYSSSSVAGGTSGRGSALQPTDTTCYLPVGDGAKFPTIASGQAFRVQIGTSELAICTARSGDTLTLTRGAESTTATTAAVGTTLQLAVTAAEFGNLWTAINQGRLYIVTDYGATGNGSTDDTSALQAAITACQNAGGGTVFFPAGTYLISSTLIISADNVTLQGASWGAIIKPAAGWTANNYLLQVQGPGGAGNFRYGIRIAEIYFNGNSVASVNGLDLVSCYAALLDHVRIRYVLGVNVNWDGISGAFGAYNYMRNCFITDGGAIATAIQTNDSEWLTIQGGHIGYFQSGGANTSMGILIQNLNCTIMGVQFDYNDTAIWVKNAGRANIVGCQFDRAWRRFLYLNNTTYNVVSDCFFGINTGGTANHAIFVDGSGSQGNLVHHNTVEAGSGWTYLVNDGSGMGGQNQYTANDTGGASFFLVTGVTRGNRGYNPTCLVPAPLAAPSLSTATTGGTVPAGTYQAEITYVNSKGETTASASASIVTTGATSTITIKPPAWLGNAYGWYAYVTQAGGSTYFRQQTAGSPTLLDVSLVLTATPTATGATPPGSNTTAIMATPSVPASGTTYQNTSGSDAQVYVSGGTVTIVAINGVTTGLTSGAFRLLAYETVTLTYSVAPTWVWVGE